MSTKAIHLESVGSLSTQAFLAIFRRFTPSRGTPRAFYSDNAANFVGASKELRELFIFCNDVENVGTTFRTFLGFVYLFCLKS